jgi:hypothetical protein
MKINNFLLQGVHAATSGEKLEKTAPARLPRRVLIAPDDFQRRTDANK